MLPLPILDDQRFIQICNSAKSMIPSIFPEWTDENAHDPGITFLELFAWLKEMQQYYLDQVTPQNEIKFLELLGIKKQGYLSATTNVLFQKLENSATSIEIIPRGTKLSAQNLIFETMEEIYLHDITLSEVIAYDNKSYSHLLSSGSFHNVAYYLFGEKAQIDNKIYLGFDGEIKNGKILNLYFDLYEDYYIKRNIINHVNLHINEIKWKYYGYKDNELGWHELNITEDETWGLVKSGLIKFKIEDDFEITEVDGKNKIWILGELLEYSGEESPRIKDIIINVGKSIEKNTLCEHIEFSSNGEEYQVYYLTSYLALTGKIRVEVLEHNYWIDCYEINDNEFGEEDSNEISCNTIDYLLHYDESSSCVMLVFSTDFGRVPPKGNHNIRIIAYDNEFNLILGSSSGLGTQNFDTSIKNIIPETLMIQVGKFYKDKGTIWEDYKLKEDFFRSKKEDKHFVLNRSTGEIIFGDNEFGTVPPEGTNNIRFLSCEIGLAEHGNIKKYKVNNFYKPAKLESKLKSLEVTNFTDAIGGVEAESLKNTKTRARIMLSKPQRMITNLDYERIAKKTPGLRIAKVKAISNFNPHTGIFYDKNNINSINNVTVVVVPFSEEKMPIANEGYCQRVRRYLEGYRLITTELHVISPIYIELSINLKIDIKPGFSLAESIIKSKLKEILSPLGDENSKGWDFGKSVKVKEILSIFDKMEFVNFVDQIVLSSTGKGAKKNSSGDVIIAPHGLVNLKSCEITFL